MTQYYIGLRNTGQWEVFGADSPRHATREASGYAIVSQEYDTSEEADKAAKVANGDAPAYTLIEDVE